MSHGNHPRRANGPAPSRPPDPPAAGARPKRVLLALDHYMHEVHKGAADYARRAAWLLEARPNHLPSFPPGSADGILTFTGPIDHFGPAVRGCGVPVVNLSPWGAEHGFPSVQLDNARIGREAADHLIDQGFRDLGMVQFMPASLTSDARRRGFEARVRAAGRRFHPLVAPPHLTYAGTLTPQMLQWLPAALARLPRPLGLLAEGDAVAVELIRTFQGLGLRVPAEIAVLGIDNDPLVAESAPVPTSSVDTDLYELGRRGAELLDRILRGEPPPPQPLWVAPRGVVARQSTDAAAFASDEVAAAVAFIRGHFREPITVADVAREVLVSRRRLQDLFAEQVGRSLLQEITRCRLELAKRMLAESPMKIGLIAEHCGLGSGPQMSKVFDRELRITPSEYRQQSTRPYRAAHEPPDSQAT